MHCNRNKTVLIFLNAASIIPDDRDDKGQDAEDEDELEIKFEDGDMFDSAFIENIKYQVILF